MPSWWEHTLHVLMFCFHKINFTKFIGNMRCSCHCYFLPSWFRKTGEWNITPLKASGRDWKSVLLGSPLGPLPLTKLWVWHGIQQLPENLLCIQNVPWLHSRVTRWSLMSFPLRSRSLVPCGGQIFVSCRWLTLQPTNAYHIMNPVPCNWSDSPLGTCPTKWKYTAVTGRVGSSLYKMSATPVLMSFQQSSHLIKNDIKNV